MKAAWGHANRDAATHQTPELVHGMVDDDKGPQDPHLAKLMTPDDKGVVKPGPWRAEKEGLTVRGCSSKLLNAVGLQHPLRRILIPADIRSVKPAVRPSSRGESGWVGKEKQPRKAWKRSEHFTRLCAGFCYPLK